MKNKTFFIISISLLGVVAMAFNTQNNFVSLQYPENWPQPVYDLSKNPLTEEGIALGRRLFYDPILSADSNFSCSNCHLSYTAFTHVDHALSHGINDSIGNRNSMTLMNLAWSSSFMWDGAVNHLDMQALAPISHPAEMGETIENVIDKLNRSEIYPSLFQNAFGENIITGEKFLKAMAQFQLTLISANSKYDRVMNDLEEFTDQENNGYELFKTNCSSCHSEPLFTNGEFENNGLGVDEILNDIGRMGITHVPKDSLHFKVPTIRNIEFSRPYMHDGRFKTLSQVLDHYTEEIQHGPSLSKELEKKLILSDNEKVDLIAFLLTLTDKEFLFNPKHAFPREDQVQKNN